MKIETLMSKSLAACVPDDSLATATRLMWDRDIGFLPVVDGEGRPVGAITDRDIAMAAYMRSRPLAEIPVGEVMSCNVVCCPAGDEISDAQEMMQDLQVRRLPVVSREGKLVGVVSVTDLARASVDPKLGNGIRTAEVASTLAVIGAPRAGDEARPAVRG